MAKSILQNEKVCYVTGSTLNLHEHHIFMGPNRKISEKHGFKVWLRADWHNMSDYGVHFNAELDLHLKQECQIKFEERHSREEFIKLIGQNFL
jgi:hypothetical protein